MTAPAPPRLLPDEPLPPYAYVPGHFPHPYSDPLGHSYQQPAPQPPPPDPARWADCRVYLQAVDLFNHGYYWEAHEAWEALWHACGRHGVLADFFKGLIQLAVSGVKIREGRPEGVRAHAERAAQLFMDVVKAVPEEKGWMGLVPADLAVAAASIAASGPALETHANTAVEVVLPLVLRPTQAPEL
jgi:predicted metal-dependent hydrolase